MSRNKLNLILGIIIAAMPFLGFPPVWKTFFYVVAGVGLIVNAFIRHVRRRSLQQPPDENVYQGE